MVLRPQRTTLTDQLGRRKTLPTGPDCFEHVGHGQRVVFIGLGPDISRALAATQGAATVAWLESPEAAAQLNADWHDAVPPHWRRLRPEEYDPAGVRTVIYTPALRLFPDFYGPLAAKARLAELAAASSGCAAKPVWLPAKQSGLLTPELAAAFAGQGWAVEHLDAARAMAQVPGMLRDHTPKLYLSVNLAGLDPHGELFYLLRAAGTRVAVWCVDNPFHLLSGLKGTFWREADLFVTDASFIAPLRGHGAKRVHHLPLGTGFFPADPLPGLQDRLVFVGRSAFPGKAAFFAGCTPKKELNTKAQAMLRRGEWPDFFWWTHQLRLQALWPDRAVRTAGCGAENTGLLWRTACLRAAGAPSGNNADGLMLTVYGDDGWAEHLPDADLRPPVDYYGPLASIYAGAGAVLNCTSPLLPAGLTQRHFDVWAAGGLLISDATPGLSLFPAELTAATTYRTPEDIRPLLGRLLADPAHAAHVRQAWQTHILHNHTYAHRIRELLQACGF